MIRYLLLLLLAGASSASAQVFTIPTQLLPRDSGKLELAPRVHAKGTTVYASWIEEKSSKKGDILFATSQDGGASFTTPVRVTTTGGVMGTMQLGGEFVIDNLDYIHMVWSEPRMNAQYDIFYSRSTDNGVTWSEAIDISRAEGNSTQDYPALAADSLGNVYVAWVDNREITGGTDTYDHIYFTRSSDNGATWNTPSKADHHANNVGGSCECCRISIQASPEGKVFIAFRGNIEHVRDIWVTRSNDMGTTWDNPIRVQTKIWVLHSCPVTGAMTTLDKAGNLHVVYRFVDAGKPYVFYNVLPSGATKTFTQIALTPSAAVNYPDVEITPSGVVYAAYQAGSDGIQYLRTTDGGATWSEREWIDDSKSVQEYAYFVTIGDSLALIWQDNRRDKADMMIAKTEDKTQGPLPALADLSRMIEEDSVVIAWVEANGGMTWYEVVTEDTTFIVLDTSLTIVRELADRSNVMVTPINSIGRGESMTLMQLSVAPQLESAVSLYPNPAASGETVILPEFSEKSVLWNIVDVSGKVVSAVMSHRSYETYESYRTYIPHQLTLPQLVDGIYYLTNDQATYKIIVRSK